MPRQQSNEEEFLVQRGILMRILIFYYKLAEAFLRNTVLNGLKYLTFKYITVWEKLFFLASFLIALYNSIQFAVTIVEKWKTSQVITVMNPQSTLISQEPFPAITICNMNQAQFSKVKDYKILFFLASFLIALYNSIQFAVTIVEKWKTSPVITVMNPQSTLISQEPFPAITICNMNQAQFSKVKDYKINSVNYALLQRLCFQDINYTAYANMPEADKQTLASFIVNNAQPCEHMVMYCEIGFTVRTCTDLFREVLLDEGLCCSFNIVHPFMLYKGEYYMIRDYTSVDGLSLPITWTPESGYPTDLPQRFYPYAALSDGLSQGLTLILNGDYHNYYCSSTNGPGLKVAFHNPMDTPHIKETGLSVALGYQTTFRITPIKEEAESSLRWSTKPHERQCYFSDEYYLHYYRYYTQRNCEMECDAQYMLDECKCIPYHMPLLSPNITICDVRHFNCVVQAEKDFEDPKRLQCKQKCLSSCNDLTFRPKSFFTPMDKDDFLISHPYLRNLSRNNLTTNVAFLKIFYPENLVRSNVKSPYMGLTEYLSQTGGIMSLMMGFSVISLVELLFFFIIKPFVKAWQKIFFKSPRLLMPTENLSAPLNYELGEVYIIKIKPRNAAAAKVPQWLQSSNKIQIQSTE